MSKLYELKNELTCKVSALNAVNKNKTVFTSVKTTPAVLSCYTADEIKNMKVEKYLSTDWIFKPDHIYGFSTIRDLEQILKSGVDDYKLAESAKNDFGICRISGNKN